MTTTWTTMTTTWMMTTIWTTEGTQKSGAKGTAFFYDLCPCQLLFDRIPQPIASSPDFRYDGKRQDGAHMELNDRIAFAGKATELTQEQLGARMGTAPRRSENGSPARPCRVLTTARLCQEMHISADFLLLGQEPEVRSGEHPGPFPSAGSRSAAPSAKTAATPPPKDGRRTVPATPWSPRSRLAPSRPLPGSCPGIPVSL